MCRAGTACSAIAYHTAAAFAAEQLPGQIESFVTFCTRRGSSVAFNSLLYLVKGFVINNSWRRIFNCDTHALISANVFGVGENPV